VHILSVFFLHLFLTKIVCSKIHIRDDLIYARSISYFPIKLKRFESFNGWGRRLIRSIWNVSYHLLSGHLLTVNDDSIYSRYLCISILLAFVHWYLSNFDTNKIERVLKFADYAHKKEINI